MKEYFVLISTKYDREDRFGSSVGTDFTPPEIELFQNLV
jgi:hypothetical protein